MHSWLQDLYPIHRSITGEGLRKTLKYLKNKLPEMKIYKAKSGTKIFDWKIPKEWKISQGYISDLNGNKLIDYKNNNLHVIGYSTSVNRIMSYEELEKLQSIVITELRKNKNFSRIESDYSKNKPEINALEARKNDPN